MTSQHIHILVSRSERYGNMVYFLSNFTIPKPHLLHRLFKLICIYFPYCCFQCCPGYVATDMSSHKGNKTIDQGKITNTIY